MLKYLKVSDFAKKIRFLSNSKIVEDYGAAA